MNNEYADFIKKIDIEEIFVSKLNIWRHEQADQVEKVEVLVESSFKTYHMEEDKLVCTPEVNVNGINSDDKSKIFSLECQITIEYSIDNELFKEEFMDRFSKTNVPLNVWPYVRELVSSATMRMGMPPLLLKAFKVV